MTQIKFTIVITTYNRLPLLRRAIDSALAQTVACEVVVADDCSSDDTQEYIRSLGDRVVYHRNPTNQGHAATMNAAVNVATGDWIKPMDDDDYIAPNCLEEMIRAIALRPQAVICSCQAVQVDVNQVEIGRTRQTGPGKAFYVPQEDIHYGMLMEVIPFGTPIQVAFRRDAFIQSGGWDSQLDVNFDDIDSWIKIAQFGDAIFINECLAYRTVWPGGYNHKFSFEKRLYTHFLIKQKIYNFVSQKHHKIIPKLKTVHCYLKLHWALVAAKQKKVVTALKLAFPSVFSLPAWQLLISAISSRRQENHLLENPLPSNFNSKPYNSITNQEWKNSGELSNFSQGFYYVIDNGNNVGFLNGIKSSLSSLFRKQSKRKLVKRSKLLHKPNQKEQVRKLVLIEK
ncbi:MAG TPA: glycosyltransferase family 2 protein [Leptolyngbyaceae cyanobacterium]